jgi:hypothetical protein
VRPTRQVGASPRAGDDPRGHDHAAAPPAGRSPGRRGVVVSEAMLAPSDRGPARLPSLVSGALLLASLALSACAMAPAQRPSSASPGAPAASPAPPPEPEPEPRSLGEAQAQLDRAVRELQAIDGSSKQLEREGDRTLDKAPPAPSPERPPSPAGAGAHPTAPDDATSTKKPAAQGGSTADTPKATAATESPCAHACRAFQSLHRAVAAVCRLAGDPSEECEKAREKETRVTARVASCGCAGQAP